MPKNFTEADTETYYNTVEIQYQIPWNPDGSKHWGYFDNLDVPTEEVQLFQACDRWNEYMLEQSQLVPDSRVLDIGCGNGNTAIYLAQKTGCEAVGIDISNTHIENARSRAESLPDLKLSFQKGTATELPFPDLSFTNVWSQGTLLHIHEREVALGEIYRVLEAGGTFIFDDMVTLVPHVSEATLQYVYDRMQLTELFTPQSYSTALSRVGFQILDSRDLSQHMKKSYDIQRERVREQFPERGIAYQKTGDAVATGEIGWWFYLCKKI